MAIPDYQTLMLPLLRLTSDGRELRFRDAIEQLAKEFRITDVERAEMLPSGTAPLFDNRVGWARTYLKQAGLFHSSKRGVFQITDDGRALLAQNPPQIDIALLDRYETFREFRSRRKDKTGTDGESKTGLSPAEASTEQTPEDSLGAAYQRLRRNLEANPLAFVPGFPVESDFHDRLLCC